MTNFSYQLYSSLNFPPLSETLKMLAGLGYNRVEGYGAPALARERVKPKSSVDHSRSQPVMLKLLTKPPARLCNEIPV